MRDLRERFREKGYSSGVRAVGASHAFECRTDFRSERTPRVKAPWSRVEARRGSFGRRGASQILGSAQTRVLPGESAASWFSASRVASSASVPERLGCLSESSRKHETELCRQSMAPRMTTPRSWGTSVRRLRPGSPSCPPRTAPRKTIPRRGGTSVRRLRPGSPAYRPRRHLASPSTQCLPTRLPSLLRRRRRATGARPGSARPTAPPRRRMPPPRRDGPPRTSGGNAPGAS